MDRQARIFADARSRWTVLIGLAFVFLAVGAGSVLLGGRFAWLADPVSVRSFIEEFGVAAPLAFVLLQAVQVVIAPIPGQVLALASGWLFGLVWGTVYSIIGATLGSYTAGCNHVKNFATPGGEYFHEVTAGSITWPSGWQGGTADRSSSVRSIQLRSIGSTISRLGGAM